MERSREYLNGVGSTCHRCFRLALSLPRQVFTDSLGYWEIRDGVVDSRYRVMAKTDGVTGRTSPLDVIAGKTVKASVLIGVEETPWPPTLSLDDKAVTVRKGPKGTRCCD